MCVKKKWVWEGFTRSSCLPDSASAKAVLTPTAKIDQSYGLVYRGAGIPEYGIKNNAYKHSFLSLPGPLAVFAQRFSICFPCCLAAWNRLNANFSPRNLSMVAGLLFWARMMDRSWTLSLYLSLPNCQLYRCSLKAHPLQEGFLYFANVLVRLACAWHISISVTSSGTTTNPKNICAVKQ